MPELMLEPFAARVRWEDRSPGQRASWENVLRGFAAEVAAAARRAGARVIGHVKGIACVDEQCLRVNCVSERRAPDVEGALPSGLRTFDLELAVLVYGLSHAQVQAAVEAALEKTRESCGCGATLEVADAGATHTHR